MPNLHKPPQAYGYVNTCSSTHMSSLTYIKTHINMCAPHTYAHHFPLSEIKKKEKKEMLTHKFQAASYVILQTSCSEMYGFPSLRSFFSRQAHSLTVPRPISLADKVLVGFPLKEIQAEDPVKLTFLCCSEDKCYADPRSAAPTVKFTLFSYPSAEKGSDSE